MPAPPSGPVRPPTVARERKPALAALALLLIAAGVLGSVYLQMQAGNRVGVIEVTKEVPQGQAIPASSISEVMVAQDSGIRYVTWAQRSLLPQYTTETALVPGTILIGTMLTTAPASTGDDTTVAVTLKNGQYPPELSVGDTVNAYYVGTTQDAPAGTVGTSGTTSGATSGAAGSADISLLLTGGVKINAVPGSSGSALGGSSNTGVFTVSVAKAYVNEVLAASAEGDLVFTSGAGS